jgi:hypothetical protein
MKHRYLCRVLTTILVSNIDVSEHILVSRYIFISDK